MTGNLLLSGLMAFCITFYAIPKVLKIANIKKLFDIPNDRKVHKDPIPSLGGVGIFIGLVLSLLSINTFTPDSNFQYFILAFIIVFFFGVKDDLIGLTPTKKIVGQLLVGVILIFKGNLLIQNLHGFLGIQQINQTIGIVLTFATIIVIMNAFNLVDGIDGLAATISIITSSTFAWIFYMNNEFVYASLGIAFASSIFAFLIFNFPPAKIFMGDAGSMLCGAVNAILVIHFINSANSFNVLKIQAAPALGFGILIMPLLDTLRVFTVRILHGRSPFSPDRNHLHHLLLDKGLSHKVITIIIGLSTIAFIVLTYLALPLGTTTIIFSQITLFFVGVGFLKFTDKNHKRKLREMNSQEDITFSKKIKHVVTLIVDKDQIQAKSSK